MAEDYNSKTLDRLLEIAQKKWESKYSDARVPSGQYKHWPGEETDMEPGGSFSRPRQHYSDDDVRKVAEIVRGYGDEKLAAAIEEKLNKKG